MSVVSKTTTIHYVPSRFNARAIGTCAKNVVVSGRHPSAHATISDPRRSTNSRSTPPKVDGDVENPLFISIEVATSQQASHEASKHSGGTRTERDPAGRLHRGYTSEISFQDRGRRQSGQLSCKMVNHISCKPRCHKDSNRERKALDHVNVNVWKREREREREREQTYLTFGHSGSANVIW